MIEIYVVGVLAYDAKNILTLLYFYMIPILEISEPLKIHICRVAASASLDVMRQ